MKKKKQKDLSGCPDLFDNPHYRESIEAYLNEVIKKHEKDKEEMSIIIIQQGEVIQRLEGEAALHVQEMLQLRGELDVMRKKHSDLKIGFDDLTLAYALLLAKYEEAMQKLLKALDDLKEEKITKKDLLDAFYQLPSFIAFSIFEKDSILLSTHPMWPKVCSDILKIIYKKQREEDLEKHSTTTYIDKVDTLTQIPTVGTYNQHVSEQHNEMTLPKQDNEPTKEIS